MNTVPLTLELLCEFLGGSIEIDNPNCQYCGSPSDVCLDPKDIESQRIKWMGVRFRLLTEMISRKPIEGTEKSDCVLEFRLKGKAYVRADSKGNRVCLVIPTDICKEEVKILK